jgi:hypothetical protein
MTDTTPSPAGLEPIYDTATRVGRRFVRAIAASIAIAGSCYVIGWVQAHAYFAGWNAPWMTGLLSASQLLAYSVLPLFIVLYLLFFQIHGVARQEEKRPANLIKRLRLVMLGMALFSGVAALHIFYGGESHPRADIILTFLLVVGFAFFMAVEATALLMIYRQGSWDATATLALAWIVGFGGYFIPTMIGQAQARRDTTALTTSLPIVDLRAPDGISYRLVLVANDTYYLAELGDATNGFPRITPVKSDAIKAIHPAPIASPAKSTLRAQPVHHSSPHVVQ